MLGLCFSVLNILGIILLILLGLLAGILFLVLFFPLSYRVCGEKSGQGFWLTVKFHWLFGFLRGNCRYPEPGRIKVKALCFTLVDQKLEPDPKKREGAEKEAGRKAKKKRRKKKSGQKRGGGQIDAEANQGDGEEPGGNRSGEGDALEKGVSGEKTSPAESAPSAEGLSSGENLSGIGKIKRTICNLYDKIKEIWENIAYYRELFTVSAEALIKVLKSIRPRRIKADIRFGTGAPDTTGYVYGAYCMAAAGSRMAVWVTPDFDEKVLEGEFDISGRITLWVLLVNGWKIYKLVRRLKAEKKVFA